MSHQVNDTVLENLCQALLEKGYQLDTAEDMAVWMFERLQEDVDPAKQIDELIHEYNENHD